MIALARKNPGQLNYAVGSIGSTVYLAAELFRAMAGVDMVRINYKGAGPALNAVLNTLNTRLEELQLEWTSRGVELEAVANLMPGLKASFAYTNYDIFTSKDLNAALVGKVPTNTPSWFTSAWADYTLQSGPLAGFGFGGGVRYVGPSYADTANTLEVPSYALFDAAVHYEWQRWRVALNVTNIADKIYVGSCSTPTACFYGDRRRALMTVAYKW